MQFSKDSTQDVNHVRSMKLALKWLSKGQSGHMSTNILRIRYPLDRPSESLSMVLHHRASH